MGMIDVLKAGKGETAGHEELALGENGAANKTKVDDLLKKKYTLMIDVGTGDQKTQKKVSSFDGDKNEFVVKESASKDETRIAAKDAKVTAIAPTSGG